MGLPSRSKSHPEAEPHRAQQVFPDLQCSLGLTVHRGVAERRMDVMMSWMITIIDCHDVYEKQGKPGNQKILQVGKQ